MDVVFSNGYELKGIPYYNGYSSDAVFANFRALSGGKMREGAMYRSASPIDNEYNRAPYVEELMKQAGVAYVLDLSDNSSEIAEFMAEDEKAGVDVSYFADLLDRGLVSAVDLAANYQSQSFARELATGLVARLQA